MLVAIGVSLLVNDTPVDVLGYGALGCLALTAWDGDARQPTSRSASALRLRAAFQSRKSTPRVDRQVEPHDARPASVVEAHRAVVAAREAAGARRPVGRPVRRDAVAAGARRARRVIRCCPNSEHVGAARPGHDRAAVTARRRSSCAPTGTPARGRSRRPRSARPPPWRCSRAARRAARRSARRAIGARRRTRARSSFA